MNFSDYWKNKRIICKVWDQKSDEDKHLHTWLTALSIGKEIGKQIARREIAKKDLKK